MLRRLTWAKLRYLDLGLGLRDLGGEPRHVRLYGRLFHPEPELLKFFERAMNERPIVIELANFPGVGVGLYPVFRAFDARPGRTVWCASRGARARLKAIGIDEDRIVEELDAARTLIARSTTPET